VADPGFEDPRAVLRGWFLIQLPPNYELSLRRDDPFEGQQYIRMKINWRVPLSAENRHNRVRLGTRVPVKSAGLASASIEMRGCQYYSNILVSGIMAGDRLKEPSPLWRFKGLCSADGKWLEAGCLFFVEPTFQYIGVSLNLASVLPPDAVDFDYFTVRAQP